MGRRRQRLAARLIGGARGAAELAGTQRNAARSLVAAALLWAGSGLAVAAAPASNPATTPTDDPQAWLARTVQALSTRNYRGIFVHEYAGETETLQVVQRVGSDGLSERLKSMDGSGREFIRRGNQLTCYLPDRHMVLVERSSDAGLLLGGLPTVDATLSGQYDVRQLKRARVSGRIARVIEVVPADQLRYGYRVWIDEATAMPLKMQLRDERGKVLEQIVFTELTLPTHIPVSELAPSVDARNYRWVQEEDTTAAAPNTGGLSVSWQAGALPPGFHMTASARQMLPGGPAEHLVFSDGLASVSVFVQSRAAAAAAVPDGAATLGTSSAYSTTVQGYRITVVGEVPPQTVRTIAQAIRSATATPAISEADSTLGVPTTLAAGSVRDAPTAQDAPLQLRSIGRGLGAWASVFGTTPDGLGGAPAGNAPGAVGPHRR